MSAFVSAGNKILEEHPQLILTQEKDGASSQYLKIVNSTDNIYIDQQGVHKIVENVRIVDDTDQNLPIETIRSTDEEVHANDSKIEIIEKEDDEEKGADSDRESVRFVLTAHVCSFPDRVSLLQERSSIVEKIAAAQEANQ